MSRTNQNDSARRWRGRRARRGQDQPNTGTTPAARRSPAYNRRLGRAVLAAALTQATDAVGGTRGAGSPADDREADR